MRVLTVYTRPGCHLCEQALAALEECREELGLCVREQDIGAREELMRAYFERIPVGVLDGEEVFQYFLDERLLRQRLASRRAPEDREESDPEHPLESTQ